MSCDDMLIRAEGLGKCYQLYDRPHHRLLQTLCRGRKRFYREFWALRDVSFELRRGESLGVVGRNGAGKSTLLQLLAGVAPPSAGNLLVKGRVTALLELGSGFNPEFTGRENAYLNGSILGLTKAEMDAAMPEIERFAGVGDFFDQPVKLYSSGMMVRVAFAVQALLKPDILIVDEALAVGDVIFQKRCYQRIRELLAGGTSLILVTHDVESVRLFAQKGLLLEGGRPAAWGGVKETLNAYQQLVLEEERRYLAGYIAAETAAVPAEAPEGTEAPDCRPGALEHGALEAMISGVRVLDGRGEAAHIFLTGDPLRIVVSFKVLKDLDSLIIGIRIRNKEGVKCHSWGTLNQDIARRAAGDARPLFWGSRFAAGSESAVAFETDSCALGPGFYEVEAQLTRRAAMDFRAEETVAHWLEEAAFFTVRTDIAKYHFGGVCDLRMRATPSPRA